MRGFRSLFLSSDPRVSPPPHDLQRSRGTRSIAPKLRIMCSTIGSAASRVSREQAAEALISAGLDARLNIEFPTRLGLMGAHSAKEIEA
jgi:hypothetical protein